MTIEREQELLCPRPETDIEALLAGEFRETGASGREYSRAEALAALRSRRDTPPAAPWEISDFASLPMAADLCLHTYRLRQESRVTARATIWRLEDGLWRAVYHQGTPSGPPILSE